MKRTLLFLLLALAPLSAQNARYSVSLPSITSQYATPFLVANVPPNSLKLSVCNAPANQGPNIPCTNYATTYNSLGVACANGSQDTPDPQPSSCQSTSDAQGNIGFYAAPGTYDWTACVQNTSTCYGPYRVTLSFPDTFGACTMTNGQCSVQTFPFTYLNTPICLVSWTGVGTLTGILSSGHPDRIAGLRPTSSVNTDTAVINWKCQGNPN
jgi:hypothetical protein